MHTFKSKRGNILLTTMLFSTAMALTMLYYVHIPITALEMSDRSFYSNAAMNLVDAGMDQAMWAVNNGNWTGFNSATVNGVSGYQGTFSYPLSGGATSSVKVWAAPNATPAQIVAQATITLPNGENRTIVKEAEGYLTASSYFKAGLVAKNTITFSGNASVDGWNSQPTPSSAPVAYNSATVDVSGSANGKVGSTDTVVGSITGSGNASIYGYAEVGGSSSSDLSWAKNGVVGPYGSSGVNPAYVTYDFSTNFPDVSTTSGGTVNSIAAINLSGNATQTLPGAGDVGVTSSSGVTTYYYSIPSISVSGNAVLNIVSKDNVVITVTNTVGTSLSTSGNGEINIPSSTSLVMYAASDVSLSGNGVLNGGSTDATANQPIDFQLYGTRSATTAASSGEQNISVSGNGVLSGVVYAPNADITISGNGDTLGSLVGNSITMSGNGSFHYDESLANLGNTGTQSLTKYREIDNATDQATYASDLSF